LKKKKLFRQWRSNKDGQELWIQPGMSVTFRAEVMPSRDASERTFRVTQVLPSGRIKLEGMAGEYTKMEFEPES
jgi:hypothetical protein